MLLWQGSFVKIDYETLQACAYNREIPPLKCQFLQNISTKKNCLCPELSLIFCIYTLTSTHSTTQTT